ncbi:MAG: hypothetical protein H6719_29245 [Sandaracinaceae bacterium]|nr:hypothetical protein [Sandaracinaceae bacterium]
MRWWCLFVLLAGCGSETASLVVQVRSDYAAPVDFDVVEVTLFGADSSVVVAQTEYLARSTDDFVAGVTVSEVDGLAPGRYELRVRLFRPDRRVTARRAVIQVDAAAVVTVLLTRSCAAVRCPDADPARTACVGGRCVDPACAAGDEAACPPPDCAATADCPAPPGGCGEPRCEVGRCLYADDGTCGDGLVCDPFQGCVDQETLRPVPGPCVDDAQCPAGANAAGVCADGACALACEAGFEDCDRDLATGCEVALGSPEHCRACGDRCAWGSCVEGACDDPVELAGGSDRMCARTSVSRSLACWGARFSGGGVGDGDPVGKSVPRWVGLRDVTSVAVGADVACATTSDAGLRCWGSQGLLPADVHVPTPIGFDLAAGERLHLGQAEYIVGLFAPLPYRLSGSSSACVLTDPPALARCFGGGFGAAPPTEPVAPLGGLGPVLDVAMLRGGDGCAVTADGSVTCWGGFYGGATVALDAIDEPVVDVELSQRGYLGCAQTATGRVHCWGEARAAALLGRGRDPGDARTPAPVDLADVEQIAVGGEAVCARRVDGSLWCWGTGPVGDGTADATYVPQPVFDAGVTDVSSAGAFTCAIVDGEVACWGRRPDGESIFIGDGTLDGSVPPRVVPPPT